MSSRAERTTSNPRLQDAIDHRRNAGGSPAPERPSSPAPSPAPSRPSSPAIGSSSAPKKGFLANLSMGQKALGGLALGGLVTVGVLALTSRKANASSTPAPSNSAQGGGASNNNGGGGGSGSNGGGGGGAPGHLSEAPLTPEQISHYKRILLGLGYTGLNADAAGTIGTYTRIALRAFQAAYNTENNSVARTGHSQPGGVGRTELFSPRTLKVDGVLGPDTRAGLDNYERYEAYRS